MNIFNLGKGPKSYRNQVNEDVRVVTPLNLGWLEKKLSDQEMDYLWKCIENKKENNNKRLAGNIHASYLLMDRGDWVFSNTISPLLTRYHEEFYNIGEKIPLNAKHDYYMNQWWVNYQKQCEFNPSHDHGGVYSFVIWMKIPTCWEDQRKLSISRNSNNQSISNFEFNYLDICGNSFSWQYRMDPTWERTMVLFPGKLRHQVYPFYNCDEDRISISGNLLLNTHRVSS